MGIQKDNIDLVKVALEAIGKPSFAGIQMCELGNQRMRFGKYKTAKKYFLARGVLHTSIDHNGKDGAVNLDLGSPINQWRDKFDIVTNYGTSEHVKNQQECFDNIDRLCRVGGAMVHSVPLTGTWKGHSPHHYSKDFFIKLAQTYDYTVILNNVVKRKENKALVCAVLVKQ